MEDVGTAREDDLVATQDRRYDATLGKLDVAQGLAGATVLRGREGFGAHSRLHTTRILRLSTDLPIVVEIVDTRDKIEAFLPVIDDAIVEGLATLEKVEVRFYRSGPKNEEQAGD